VNLREQNAHIDVSEYHVRKDMKNQNVRRLLAVEIHVIRVRSNVLSVTYGKKIGTEDVLKQDIGSDANANTGLEFGSDELRCK
jgi:hypothetical protein